LGISPNHASSVPLVLSTTTGLISPQFHVVFDDQFSTTESLCTNALPTNWSTLLSNSSISFVDEDFTQTNFYKSQWQTNQDPTSSTSTDSPSAQREPISSSPSMNSSSLQREPSVNPDLNLQPHPTTSSSIIPGWNQHHQYNTRFKHLHAVNPTNSLPSPTLFTESSLSALLAAQDLFPTGNPTSFHALQSVVTASSSLPKDNLHYGEMIHDPDCNHFEHDMRRERSDLFASDTLEVIPRSSIPSDNKPLQAIWSFRRKRRPDWTIAKYKARLCPHGGQQIEGINYWETYAPVVSWRTVRLTLVLSLLSGLKSRQVDYVSAYTQAPLDCELFLNIPPGFSIANGSLSYSEHQQKLGSQN
jgi:hypothetical protein